MIKVAFYTYKWLDPKGDNDCLETFLQSLPGRIISVMKEHGQYLRGSNEVASKIDYEIVYEETPCTC